LMCLISSCIICGFFKKMSTIFISLDEGLKSEAWKSWILLHYKLIYFYCLYNIICAFYYFFFDEIKNHLISSPFVYRDINPIISFNKFFYYLIK
jgi:hypothetical protein